MDVFNNMLETNNKPGWQSFAPVRSQTLSIETHSPLCNLSLQNEVGSEMMLLNVESYGQYFADALTNRNVNVSATISDTMAIIRDNICELEAT